MPTTRTQGPCLEVSRPIGFARIDAFRDKQTEMRVALYAVAQALPNGVPSPRSFWYDLTKEERTRIIALDDDVTMCRAALHEAQRYGAKVVAEVRARIHAYFASKADAALCGYENDCDTAIPPMAAHVVKELSDVSVAAARLAADPSPANRHALRHEASEGLDVLSQVMRSAMVAHGRAS
jgi:hypothetical protein